MLWLLGLTILSAEKSSLKISDQECLRARYGHIPGGTMHSRKVLGKRLLQKSEKQTGRTRKETLAILRKKYPELNITHIDFIIRNCYGYYRFERDYFDPLTLERISRGEKR